MGIGCPSSIINLMGVSHIWESGYRKVYKGVIQLPIGDAEMVKHKELEKIVKRHLETKMPLMIFGSTGIGKSQTIKSVAKEYAKEHNLKYSENWEDIDKDGYYCLVDIRGSTMDRTDISGYPVADREKGKMEYFMFEGFPHKGEGVLFLDEINLAPTSVQKALYSIILDRRIHNYRLPDGYTVIGAGNTFEDRADITSLPAPLEQRLTNITLEPPTADEWIDWAIQNNIDNRIIAYIKRFPDKLFRFNAEIIMSGQPVPRQWEALSKLIGGIDDLGLLKLLAVGRIGEPTAVEFKKFLELSKALDIDAIWNGKEQIPEEFDLAYAVMPSLMNIFNRDKKANFDRAIEIAEQFEKVHSPEYAVLFIKMVKASLDEKEALALFYKNQKSREFLKRYARYFKCE